MEPNTNALEVRLDVVRMKRRQLLITAKNQMRMAHDFYSINHHGTGHILAQEAWGMRIEARALKQAERDLNAEIEAIKAEPHSHWRCEIAMRRALKFNGVEPGFFEIHKFDSWLKIDRMIEVHGQPDTKVKHGEHDLMCWSNVTFPGVVRNGTLYAMPFRDFIMAYGFSFEANA